MDKIKAFFLAFLLIAATAAAGHFLPRYFVGTSPDAYALWTSEAKASSYEGLVNNLTDQMTVVFGSSEMQHGDGTLFHPSSLFQDTVFKPMLIGAGYYQSLSHAITLAAIEKEMPVRKAVLILSPQWFRKTGVLPQAYVSRFSELMYLHMLSNESLSETTKAYLSERTHLLLQDDERTLRCVDRDEAVLWKGLPNRSESLSQKIWTGFLAERDYFSIWLRQFMIPQKNKKPVESEPDWEAYLSLADELGEKENNNVFYMQQESYERLLPYLEIKRGMNADATGGYQYGPEFTDLGIFLQVCRETGIEPLLVIVPVNGYYYDFTEFPASARQAYYEKIRGIAADTGASLADFSSEEYTPYFFEDRVHLGKKGWVKVSEAIYRFVQGEAS